MESRLEGTEFKAIVETDDQVEISFKRHWDTSLQTKLAHLHTDIRLIGSPLLCNIYLIIFIFHKSVYIDAIL
jgi:Rhamnogalacturonate lyase family